MRFDHLIHVVPDRSAAIEAYERSGFHVVVGGEHPHWGSHNALIHFGLGYIELLALLDETQVASGPPYIFRGASDLSRNGGGALTFAVAVSDLSQAIRMLRARGLDVGEPDDGRRRRPDGTELVWRCAGLLSGPDWRPFLIQWGSSDDDRLRDLQARAIDAPHPQGPLALETVVATATDPAADAAWAQALFGQPARRTEGGWVLTLPGCNLTITGRGDVRGEADVQGGLSLRLRGKSQQSLSLCGLSIEIQP